MSTRLEKSQTSNPITPAISSLQIVGIPKIVFTWNVFYAIPSNENKWIQTKDRIQVILLKTQGSEVFLVLRALSVSGIASILTRLKLEGENREQLRSICRAKLTVVVQLWQNEKTTKFILTFLNENEAQGFVEAMNPFLTSASESPGSTPQSPILGSTSKKRRREESPKGLTSRGSESKGVEDTSPVSSERVSASGASLLGKSSSPCPLTVLSMVAASPSVQPSSPSVATLIPLATSPSPSGSNLSSGRPVSTSSPPAPQKTSKNTTHLPTPPPPTPKPKGKRTKKSPESQSSSSPPKPRATTKPTGKLTTTAKRAEEPSEEALINYLELITKDPSFQELVTRVEKLWLSRERRVTAFI